MIGTAIHLARSTRQVYYEEAFILTHMTKIPVLTDAIQTKHAGEQGAVVNGKFVAFGKSLQELYAKAKAKGYKRDQVMIVPIPRPNVSYI